MRKRKGRKYFNNISVDYLDVSPYSEVRVITPQTIEHLKKTFAGKWTYEKVSWFLARVLSKDNNGLTIQLALAHVKRLHLVSEHLSFNDIESLKIGRDGETYIVIKKKRYNSLWKKHSVSFAFIDLIGTKEIFKRSSDELMKLLKKVQAKIDAFANIHPTIAILSFADSLIVKTVWSYHKKITYSPENFLNTILQLRSMLRQEVGIDSYVILTQGQNFIESKKLVHVNNRGNHFGMLSVGPPFASLFGIDSIVKELRNSDKRSLYIEKMFYDSLNDKSLLNSTTMKTHLFDSSFLKTTGEFIAIDVK